MELTLIILAVIIILLMLMLVIYRRRTQEVKPNYLVFFIIGVSWLPIGISTKNPVFTSIGAIFFIIGLAKHKTWQQGPKWNELSPASKKVKIIAIIALGLLFLAGFVLYILTRNGTINL